MTSLYNPYGPRPTYPAWKAEAQIAARAALPHREIVQRYLYIAGPDNPSPDILFKAHNAALHAWRQVATGWNIIVASDGIARRVIETCTLYNIPFVVEPSARRALERADKVVCWNRPDVLLAAAYKLKIPCYINGVLFAQLALPFPN